MKINCEGFFAKKKSAFKRFATKLIRSSEKKKNTYFFQQKKNKRQTLLKMDELESRLDRIETVLGTKGG